MDGFWIFWNSLAQGFRENLAAQIIGGITAILVAGGITFFIVRVLGKKESPSQKTSQSSSQQTQQQQVIVNVGAPQIVQPPPIVAITPSRGDVVETLHATSLQTTPIPRPRIGFVPRRDKDGHDLVEFVGGLLAQGTRASHSGARARTGARIFRWAHYSMKRQRNSGRRTFASSHSTTRRTRCAICSRNARAKSRPYW